MLMSKLIISILHFLKKKIKTLKIIKTKLNEKIITFKLIFIKIENGKARNNTMMC